MEGARIAELALFMEKFINNHGAPAYAFLSIDETVLKPIPFGISPGFSPISPTLIYLTFTSISTKFCLPGTCPNWRLPIMMIRERASHCRAY